MLPNKYRLKNKKDFDLIFKTGIRLRERFLELRVLKNQLANSRFGFIIAKSVAKKATARNKTKRRLRELVRERLMGIKNGFDCVFVSRADLSAEKFSEMDEIVRILFEKAKILK